MRLEQIKEIANAVLYEVSRLIIDATLLRRKELDHVEVYCFGSVGPFSWSRCDSYLANST